MHGCNLNEIEVGLSEKGFNLSFVDKTCVVENRNLK